MEEIIATIFSAAEEGNVLHLEREQCHGVSQGETAATDNLDGSGKPPGIDLDHV